MLDGHVSYQSVKYLYIDDPISSLDDNNAIAVACDLAQLPGGNEPRAKTALRAHQRVFSTHTPCSST